jgi:uncharacterized Zn-binding protein involved in type VI secretion
MPAVARHGDRVSGGYHCHSNHGPHPSPGRIVEGSTKVLVEGRPVARLGDEGHSPLCCAGIGRITLLPPQRKVLVEGLPIALAGDPTAHCDGMGAGTIATGSRKVSCR